MKFRMKEGKNAAHLKELLDDLSGKYNDKIINQHQYFLGMRVLFNKFLKPIDAKKLIRQIKREGVKAVSFN